MRLTRFPRNSFITLSAVRRTFQIGSRHNFGKTRDEGRLTTRLDWFGGVRIDPINPDQRQLKRPDEKQLKQILKFVPVTTGWPHLWAFNSYNRGRAKQKEYIRQLCVHSCQCEYLRVFVYCDGKVLGREAKCCNPCGQSNKTFS